MEPKMKESKNKVKENSLFNKINIFQKKVYWMEVNQII